MSKRSKGPTPPATPTEKPAALHDTAPKNSFHWLEQRPWLAVVIPIILATWAYAGSLDNTFVYFDDDKAILYNQTLQKPSLSGFFSGQNLGMYAPLTWIAYWVAGMIPGQEAYGYHLIGLLLHVLNAGLLFFFLLQLSGRPWPALFASVLFAVHPVQAEAVGWAAAMSTVLFSTFYLLAAFAYLRWKRSPTLLWYFGALAAFLLAVLSKSAAVTLPLLLLAIDFYLDKKLIGKFWLSKIPFFLIALIFGWYTFETRAQEGHDIEAASSVFSAVDRFWMVSQTLLFYPVKLLLPLGFSVAYPFVKTYGAWSPEYYAAPAVLAALAWVLWRYFRHNRDVLWGVALYLLPLTVMLPFRTVGSFELRSDRYVYLSCAGIFYLLALALERLPRLARLAVLVGVSTVLGSLAVGQVETWSDGVKLFENCVEKTPESSLCQCNLAYNQLVRQDYKGAAFHYTEALRYDPSTVEAYNGRGQAYFQLKQIPQALEDFNNAIAAGISTPKLFLNRGKCLVMLNRPADAVPDLRKSLELEPRAPETYFFLGAALEKTGDIDGALQAYGKATELKPDYLEAWANRGFLYLNNKRHQEAVADFGRAIQLNPKLAMLWNNRANAHYQLGQLDKALADAEEALRADPNYARAYQTRGAVRIKLGQTAAGQADLQKAGQLMPR